MKLHSEMGQVRAFRPTQRAPHTLTRYDQNSLSPHSQSVSHTCSLLVQQTKQRGEKILTEAEENKRQELEDMFALFDADGSGEVEALTLPTRE